jgi:outer membrane lipoprotein LolB
MLLAQRAGLSLALVASLLAGCAHPVRPPEQRPAQFWSGRLALQVEESQSQSFAAGFELEGSAQTGELKLFSPLGGTLAQLAWAPGSATLNSGGKTHQFDSLEALAAKATGTPLPVAALFDWLRGVNTPVPGWEADLSQLAEGRLRARRVSPPPAADLRVAIDK